MIFVDDYVQETERNIIWDVSDKIQAALDDAAKRSFGAQPAGGSCQYAYPMVVFGPRKYTIAKPLRLSSYHRVVGDQSMICQIAEQPCFVISNCYRNYICGLQFLFGTRQIEFSNPNTDMTELTVEHCTFQAWTDKAIVAAPSGGQDHMSATLQIHSCVFDGGQILETWCDTTDVYACRHQFRGTLMPGVASMVNAYSGGCLNVTEFTGVPVLSKLGGASYWVRNRGSVAIQRSRLGGEFGGIPNVLDEGGPVLVNPWIGRRVLITDSLTCAGQDSWERSAVLTLAGLPQGIFIERNSGLVSNTIPVVKAAPGYDLRADVNAVYSSAKPSVQMYRASVSKNQYYTKFLLPSELSWMLQ